MAKQESHKLQSQVRFLAAQPFKNMIAPIKEIINSTERHAHLPVESMHTLSAPKVEEASDISTSEVKNFIYNEKGLIINNQHNNNTLNAQA